MKAFTMLAFASCLALLVAIPLTGDDKERSRDQFGDFGQSKLEREAVDLQLKLEDGKTYRWTIEAKPHPTGQFSSPQTGTEGSRSSDQERSGAGRDESSRRSGSEERGGHQAGQGDSGKQMCRHEAEAKVTKASGDESTITFTFDASKCEMCKEQAKKQGREAPDKLVYNVRANRRGEIVSFQKEGAASGGQATEFENLMRTQTRELLGDGLHVGRLEPGRSYDVAWMNPENWKKGAQSGREPATGAGSSTGGQGSTSASGSATGRDTSAKAGMNYQLRYDGRTEIDDQKVARFTIVPATGTFSSPGSTGTESTGREPTGGAAIGTGRESGYAAFRLEDGLLERFAFVLPAAVIKEIHKDEVKGQGQEHGAGMQGDMLITIRRTR